MELELVNQELSESKLFRFTGSFSRLTGRDIADLLYLQTLSVIMFSKDNEQQDYAVAYARKSTAYGPFALFRTHATDIYMLSYAIKHSDNSSLKISGKDRRFLDGLQFNNRTYYNFLRKLGQTAPTRSEISSFLVRLERQLDIKDSQYKLYRRLIVDWSDLKYAQKQMVVARIMQKMRIKARPSEVFQHLVAMKTTRAYKEPKQKSDTLKRTAATIGGAYVGSKVVPKLTKGKLGSKTGAGIGAIAGYWASGRKKL